MGSPLPMSGTGKPQSIGEQISERLGKLSADLVVDKGEMDAPGVKIADKELSEGRAAGTGERRGQTARGCRWQGGGFQKRIMTTGAKSALISPPAAREPIIAPGGRYYRRTRYFITVVLLFYGGWCIYDGFYNWLEPHWSQAHPDVQPYPPLSIHLNQALGIMLPPGGAADSISSVDQFARRVPVRKWSCLCSRSSAGSLGQDSSDRSKAVGSQRDRVCGI